MGAAAADGNRASGPDAVASADEPAGTEAAAGRPSADVPPGREPDAVAVADADRHSARRPALRQRGRACSDCRSRAEVAAAPADEPGSAGAAPPAEPDQSLDPRRATGSSAARRVPSARPHLAGRVADAKGSKPPRVLRSPELAVLAALQPQEPLRSPRLAARAFAPQVPVSPLARVGRRPLGIPRPQPARTPRVRPEPEAAGEPPAPVQERRAQAKPAAATPPLLPRLAARPQPGGHPRAVLAAPAAWRS